MNDDHGDLCQCLDCRNKGDPGKCEHQYEKVGVTEFSQCVRCGGVRLGGAIGEAYAILRKNGFEGVSNDTDDEAIRDTIVEYAWLLWQAVEQTCENGDVSYETNEDHTILKGSLSGDKMASGNYYLEMKRTGALQYLQQSVSAWVIV